MTDICIICDEPVEPGTGGVQIGPFPALHAKCAKRANDEAGGHLDDAQLTEAMDQLLNARVRLGRAVTGLSPEVVIAGVGLLLCDVLAHVRSDKFLVAAGLVEEIRHLGEMMAAGAVAKDPQ